MAIALLSSVKSGSSNGATTSAIDTTGAKLLIAALTYNNGVTPTLTDSAGNTWTPLTATSDGSTRSTRLYYCINPTVSAAHTFTYGPTSVLGALVVSAWSASGSVAFDKEVGGFASGASVTVAGAAASVTPANNNSLLLTAFGFGANAVTASPGSGWSLIQCQDGVASTNFGCGALYQIQTTAATIAAATVIGTATGAGNQVDRTAVFYEAASASITVSTPSAFEVHQRSGTTGSIQISGTVSGPTEDIEASFNGGAYQTIATNVAAGSFSGTLTGQAQGQGTLTVRKKTTTSASATVANVGIGDVFLLAGDSRAEGRGTNGQAYTHATLKAAKFSGGAWAELTEASSAGTIAPLMATRIMASQGVPVAFIYTGVGGTDVAGVNNTWAKPNGQYNAAVSAVTSSTVSGVKGAIFLLGPNAIYNANGAAIPLATYRTALDTLATNIAADLPGAPKLFVDVCGEMASALPPDPRTARDNIRGAVLSAWTNNSTAIKGGPVLIEQDYADNVHPKTDAELLVQANRYWLAVEAALYSGTRPRGPRVSSAQWNAGRNQLTVVFDQALKTGLTHATQAWIVNDVGGLGAMTISSVAYHGSNPNALVLTTSAAATGANGSTRLSFASGDDAVGRVVPLGTDISLPGGGAANQPAEPIYAYAVSEFAATATTVTLTLTTDGSTPAASKTGLSWAFFDQVTPGSFLTPTAKGTGASTNGSGVFSVSITGTALLVGATGYLIVSNTDGTPGQSPAADVFSGPVVVS
ncbi:hypothetical protein [Roseateles asaccharophilus]|uniref:SGNH hydrolase-type esterase domain-containing protein n=1 Tax=Roseateles asaccharophilus TaxID=582607 RepID=A0ABU2A3J5_9BURK|nr:hypothetical protein [Roseateles asaccharophilus]MDR7331759.1 hypothetical protein [Roseateles asaccharophilus]